MPETGDGTLHFTNLPLVEVALRVVPAEELPLSISTLQRLSCSLCEPFDEIRDLSQIESPPGVAEFKLQAKPLNAFSISAYQEAITLDVHSQLLILRWREQASQRVPYPKFAAMMEHLRRILAVLLQAAQLPAFQAKVANMSYRNFVENPDSIRQAKIPVINLAFSSPTLMDHSSILTDLNLGWTETGSHLDFRVRLDKGELRLGTPEESVASGLVLTTICGAFIEDGQSFEDGLRRCHARLIQSFKQLIDDETLTKWGYQDV